MRPGRELDARVAKEVLGHRVWAQAKVLYENAAKGDRPLRNYTKDMEWATEVMEAMKISVLAIEGGQWFAFSGPIDIQGWESPQAMLEFLNAGNFEGCGAAVGDKLPAVICEAALRAAEKRNGEPVVVETAAIGEASAPVEIHVENTTAH